MERLYLVQRIFDLCKKPCNKSLSMWHKGYTCQAIYRCDTSWPIWQFWNKVFAGVIRPTTLCNFLVANLGLINNINLCEKWLVVSLWLQVSTFPHFPRRKEIMLPYTCYKYLNLYCQTSPWTTCRCRDLIFLGLKFHKP